MDEIAFHFKVGLIIKSRPWVEVVRGLPSPPLTNSKGKQTRSISLIKKAKKNKGLTHYLDFILGPNKASIRRVEVGGDERMVP